MVTVLLRRRLTVEQVIFPQIMCIAVKVMMVILVLTPTSGLARVPRPPLLGGQVLGHRRSQEPQHRRNRAQDQVQDKLRRRRIFRKVSQVLSFARHLNLQGNKNAVSKIDSVRFAKTRFVFL